MKRLYQISIVCFLFVGGCNLPCGIDLNDVAVVPDIYIQLRDRHSGQDNEFFSVNSAYNYTDMSWRGLGGFMPDDRRFHLPPCENPCWYDSALLLKEQQHIVANRLIHASAGFKELLIDFGNGDVDTLSQVTMPPEFDSCNIPDHISFYMNGKLVYSIAYNRDIHKERTSRASLWNEPFNPFIYLIAKKPEK